MSDSDKRKSPRMELILKVNYPSSESFLSDYIRNASEGGVFIETTRSFSSGEQLVFDISFPGLLEPLQCHGEVRWRRSEQNATEDSPAGIGVAFLFDNPEQEAKIKKLMKELSQFPIPSPSYELSKKPFHVVVAEDNPVVREMFAFGLKKYHQSSPHLSKQMKIFEAGNGQEAWEYIQNESVDLLITDFYMPIMNGGSLIKLIRADRRVCNLPVIVISAADDEVRREVYEAGADLFLNKPVLMGTLSESLHRLLDLKEHKKGKD